MKKILSILFATLIATTVYAGATRTVTDHLGRSVEIPADPKRIASLHTMSTTVMLWDLGASLIGTATRIKKPENTQYIRGVEEIYNVKFADTGLYSYGSFGKDIEQIKASKPDLIVATTYHAKQKEQLEAIAPVVFFDNSTEGLFDHFRDLADWVNKTDVFNEKNAKYQKRLAQVKAKFTSDPTKMSFIYATANPGKAELWVSVYYGAVAKVVYDLGFKPLPWAVKQFPDGGSGAISAEVMGDLNADYFASTYRGQYGQTAEDAYKTFDEVAPGWRDYNKAYLSGTFVMLNRENAFPSGFKTYNYVLNEFAKYIK